MNAESEEDVENTVSSKHYSSKKKMEKRQKSLAKSPSAKARERAEKMPWKDRFSLYYLAIELIQKQRHLGDIATRDRANQAQWLGSRLRALVHRNLRGGLPALAHHDLGFGQVENLKLPQQGRGDGCVSARLCAILGHGVPCRAR